MKTNLPVRALTQHLIAAESITPNDAGCQPLINELLETHDFTIKDFSLEVETSTGKHTVTNTFAYYEGQCITEGPSVIFAGHTDIVGVEGQAWQADPFTLAQDNDQLIGRGIADMKGGLAPTITAAAKFVEDNPHFSGKIGFIITSFEEIASDKELNVTQLGTNHVVEKLLEQGYPVDYVVLGEPASTKTVGDTIKNGRRAPFGINLQLTGEAGHTGKVSPDKNALNIEKIIGANILSYEWAPGDDAFEPITINHTTLTGTNNSPLDNPAIVPADVFSRASLRFGTPHTSSQVQAELQGIIDAVSRQFPGVNIAVDCKLSGEPFLTSPNSPLIVCARKAIQLVTGIATPGLSAAGGASDGRFLVKLKNAAGKPADVIEVGNVGTTIHQANEAVPAGSLEQLEAIYYGLLKEIFA